MNENQDKGQESKPAPLPSQNPSSASQVLPAQDNTVQSTQDASTTQVLRAKIDDKLAGSYICVEKIAEGGMGVIFRGIVNPYIELFEKLKAPAITDEARALRRIAGLDAQDTLLTPDQEKRAYSWTLEKTADLIENPSMIANCEALLQYLNPRRARFIGKGLQPAIKLLRPEFLKDERVVERFRREINIMENLDDHPNIVKVVESGKKGDQYYIVMEYVDAIPLDKEAGKLPIPQTTWIVRHALEGLIHAHNKGILHRDIKPENILVSKDFRSVKLTDFGIAKALESKDGNLTKTQEIVGSGFYIDPERFGDKVAVKESDAYSLGATFYKLLTGKPPTRSTTLVAIMNEFAQNQEPKWVREERPEVSEMLEDTVMMMLSKDLTKRLTTSEVKKRLDDLTAINQLIYRAPAPSDQARAQELKQIIQKYSRARIRSQRATNRTRVQIIAHDRLGDLQPRNTALGINARIDHYEAAIKLYHAAANDPQTANITETLKLRAKLLEKKCALEYRRLNCLKFERVKPMPQSHKKPVLVGLTALGLIGLGSYVGLTFYNANIERVHQKEVTARLNSEFYERALSLSHDVERYLKAQEYFRAKKGADDITTLLGKITQPTGELREKINVVRVNLEKYDRELKKQEIDLTVYVGIIPAIAEAEKNWQNIEKSRTPQPETITTLANTLERLGDVLNRAVKPEAVGKEEYAQQFNRIEGLLKQVRAYGNQKDQK
jgi:serine/threonine protein kinase